MYQRHFGFKERPFRLVPDPTYLFMGRSHREAMAHLSYAVRSEDGFATVIGEVGTGKTTLCRAFLQELGPEVTSAYIFNPPADPVDLMRAVNRDFGLPVDCDRLQDLSEDLNRFLIREKAEGRTALLVIDEAQRLSRQVLEQIRLLSNLETTRSKLLLIVLAGQPELEDTLAAHDLRQLRQRITASCRLIPFTPAETSAYIRHRLVVAADGPPPVFTAAAMGVVFRFSRGIPRLTNVACDRALLAAYAVSAVRIGRRLARQAVRELQNDAPAPRPRRRPSPVLVAAMVAAVATLWFHQVAEVQTEVEPPAKSIAPRAAKAPPPLPSVEKKTEAAQPLVWRMDRSRAWETVANLWGLSPSAVAGSAADDESFFRRHAASLGMSVYPVSNRFDLLVRLNLPALLVCEGIEGGEDGYGVLAAVQDDRFLMAAATGARHPLTREELQAQWKGMAYVPWRDFYALTGDIPGEASDETVLNLKVMLRELGYAQIESSPIFDAATRRAVVDFQARMGLVADGVVGSQTKIALYSTRPELATPLLRPLAPVQRAALPRGS